MSDQNVPKISSLLEAVLEYRRVVSASQHNNTPADQMRMIAFVQRSSSPLISIIFELKLTILATTFRQSVKAIKAANPENDADGWYSAIEDHRWFLAELVIVLKSICAHPSLIQEYGEDSMGMSASCDTSTDRQPSGERSTSGLILEGIGKVRFGEELKEPGNTIPYQLLVIADKHFGEVVPYSEISTLWGKAGPTDGARRRNVSSVNTDILKPLGAPLELKSKRNTGIILQLITSDK